MTLSIIIPVYCVAHTLGRCLRSVTSQSFSDFEVILVDDGSPDECPQLCDRWAREDKRITVVHQRNGGLSAARNTGIERARGDYLTFVDSDDYLDTGTLEAAMAAIGDADMVEYPIWCHYGSEQQVLLTPEDRCYGSTAEYWLQGQAYLHTYATNKIYRRWLFDQIRFPVGRVFEDAWTLPRLLHLSPRIRTTGGGCYYYCDNERGITATAGGAELRQLLDSHLTAGMPMDDLYYLHLLNIQMDVYEMTGDELRLPRRRVRPAGSLRMRLKALALNILGIKGICRTNVLIHRLCR